MSGERRVWDENLNDDELGPTGPFRGDRDEAEKESGGRRFDVSGQHFHGEQNAAKTDGAAEDVGVVFKHFR